MEKGSLWESSDVLAPASRIRRRHRDEGAGDGTPGSVVTSKWAFPDPSVVTSVDPRIGLALDEVAAESWSRRD